MTFAMNRRDMLRLVSGAALGLCSHPQLLAVTPPDASSSLHLSDGPVSVFFRLTEKSLKLEQIQQQHHPAILYTDSALVQSGPGPIGNPLALVIWSGAHQGTYDLDSFNLTGSDHTSSRFLGYFHHPKVPMQFGMEVSVEGDVISWRGQLIWNGPDDTEIDCYFPLLSRICFDSAAKDRLIAGELSGSEKGPTAAINYSSTYIGGLSSPVYLIEGAGHGLAMLEDNRADYAADPGGCSQRSAVVATRFPLPVDEDAARDLPPGADGPYAGWRHRRLFLGASRFGGQAEYDQAEAPTPLPLTKLGDSLDLGPVYTYLYTGTWKQGALWLREKRQHLPFRRSPAKWYQETTVLSEEMPNRLVHSGMSLYDLPLLLEERHALGSDMMSLPGFSEPEILGTTENFLNRGDYFYPAANLGSWDAVQQGVQAAHRQGGHVLFYVEGLIVWERSRIGRSHARDWALMDADGKLTENYRGFFDMCPAEPGWQEWFARTLADVVRTTGVDGFFMDSMLATDNHRCFNPRHQHSPQPDIWNWGIRRVLARVREEVDKVNPDIILLCEGVGDLAREFIDGSLSHGHAWSRMTFTVPLLRFLHPEMRAFEADGMQPHAEGAPRWPVEKPLLWNAVQGYRVFVEQESHEQLAALARRVRSYYDMYPEICGAQMSASDVLCDSGQAQLFESLPRVLTVGNDSNAARTIGLRFPQGVDAGLLFDRVTGRRIPVLDGNVLLPLQPWDFQAFELRA